jgi:hypothetical protein
VWGEKEIFGVWHPLASELVLLFTAVGLELAQKFFRMKFVK